MKLVPCEKINAVRHYVKNDNFKTVMEFKESNSKCAKVEGFTQKNARICTASLRHTIRDNKINDVYVTYRGNEVYLIKEDF